MLLDQEFDFEKYYGRIVSRQLGIVVDEFIFGRQSVGKDSGQRLRVRVQVRTEPLPTMRSDLSIHLNSQFAYGSMTVSQPF